MIIIEFVINSVKFTCWAILKFIFWLITARDCKHCEHSFCDCGTYDTYYTCTLSHVKREECNKSITGKYFQRKGRVTK